ncbi:hypothetical protein [Tengunoibacter tsumagoiensis]|uniref:Uncharacterized protein n=1 Tax=Tengunoibacter tsumagoiensis TaxID=2014871 RepID=A0A402A078_9CHLR|nr:hypothetical protein [Tengunoibacter tsumagoiensis]GCE12466.1 hypothetical protein KTT_23250 [Tengunoibacter tsumagoiensis]
MPLIIRLEQRCSEVAKLTLADIGLRQGHHTLHIRQSKEEKDWLLKLPVDLWRMLFGLSGRHRNHRAPHGRGWTDAL